MNAALHPLRRLLFGLVLLVSFSFAQEEDALLQNYSLGVENLSQAFELMSSDSLQSTDALERASQALRYLAGSSNSTALVSQLENTFTRAKTTIQNQSQADLGVQVAVLKGGFQRLVYEAAIASANAGDVATTQRRLTRIASNSGLSEEIQNALSTETDLSKLFATFEQGSAGVVKAHLSNVLGLLATDKGVAYRTLAMAYGTYLPIADSPRADASSGSLFTESFTALVGDNTDTLTQAVNQLTAQMDTMSNAASQVVSGAATAAIPTIEVAATEIAATEVTPTTELAAEVAPASETSTEVATTDVAATEVTPEAVQSEVVNPVDVTETGVDPALVDPALAPVVTLVNPFTEPLTGELARLGLSPNQQTNVAKQLLADGYTSVGSVVNTVVADTSFAMNAVQEGNQALAKSTLQKVQGTYSTYLSSLVTPEVDQSTQGLLQTLTASPSLRQEDVATLNQQWAAVSNALGGNAPVSGLQGLANTVTGFWSGWTRTIVMIVLGLFAFMPLYLLFLAFGGGNRNWQLIGYALFLLLVPVIYEGLSFLLGAINSVVNVPALDILSRFSFFQNPVMQVLWAVLTAIAIALATMGLYGICVQFGLIGKKEDVGGTVVESAPNKTSIESAKNTNFEWDEEF
jgi:hypothetical protein